MNVPDVVQALRMMTSSSPCPGRRSSSGSAPKPKSSNSGLRPSAPRTLVEQAVGRDDEDPQHRDRRRAGDGREVERRPEERPAADLLVDDDRQEQAEGHRQRHPDDRVVERVLDRPSGRSGRSAGLGVVVEPQELDRAGADVPVPDADVHRVEDRRRCCRTRNSTIGTAMNSVAGERLRATRSRARSRGRPPRLASLGPLPMRGDGAGRSPTPARRSRERGRLTGRAPCRSPPWSPSTTGSAS